MVIRIMDNIRIFGKLGVQDLAGMHMSGNDGIFIQKIVVNFFARTDQIYTGGDSVAGRRKADSVRTVFCLGQINPTDFSMRAFAQDGREAVVP
ncbi:hypothetical protein SDC9_188164 [bioreactor metagenome]|uniref:Uncharacterized protein n=1 Tax=bioreactor metagenome TaxID=1076179 RepID=A0A645HPY8_9ZZZZ